MRSGIWALVVGRTGPAAKSRLAPVLSPEERRALARAMLADVLAACQGAPFAGRVAVVDSPEARALAAAGGALVLPDPGAGLNAAVAVGLRALAAAGATTAVVLPSDVPLLAAEDVAALVGAAGDARRAVVVGTDRADQGTNALLVRPPTLIQPAYGPGSADHHLAAGRLVGARVVRRTGLALALDVDTPEDLAELRRRRPGGATGVLLERLGTLAGTAR